MIEEVKRTREELMAQANTSREDRRAQAWQGHNELIEIAWQSYGATKEQAEVIYEAAEIDNDQLFQDELALIEVEMGAKTGPAADQLPETVGTHEYDHDSVTVGATVSPETSAGSTNIGYGPEDQELDVDGIPIKGFRAGSEGDVLCKCLGLLPGLDNINETYFRSQGERRIVRDGLLALADMMSERLVLLKAPAEQPTDESEKGGVSSEIDEGGG